MIKSISCIVPIYGLTQNKNLQYFEELLESLFIAIPCLGDNFELIIVNDDRKRISRKLVLDICKKHRLQKYVVYEENIENRGQAFSRNIGASLAQSKYLHFIDQDDYISENYYTELITYVSEFDMYLFKPYFFMQKTGQIRKAYTYILKCLYVKSRTVKELWPLMLNNIAYSPGQVIISKDAYTRNGGFPVLSNKGSDDYGLFYHMVFDDNVSFIYMDAARFFYRVHSQQSSRNCNMNSSVCEFLQMVKPNSCKSRLIHFFKTKKYCTLFVKAFYILVFKRG